MSHHGARLEDDTNVTQPDVQGLPGKSTRICQERLGACPIQRDLRYRRAALNVEEIDNGTGGLAAMPHG